MILMLFVRFHKIVSFILNLYFNTINKVNVNVNVNVLLLSDKTPKNNFKYALQNLSEYCNIVLGTI